MASAAAQAATEALPVSAAGLVLLGVGTLAGWPVIAATGMGLLAGWLLVALTWAGRRP